MLKCVNTNINRVKINICKIINFIVKFRYIVFFFNICILFSNSFFILAPNFDRLNSHII